MSGGAGDLRLLTDGEWQALREHLLAEPGTVEAHIQGGGTLAGYVAGWREARNAVAAAKEISAELVDQVLGLPVPRWDPEATVRDWLAAFLRQVWLGIANYEMAGNSDWRYDLYEPLSRAGVIRGWRDGYGVGYRDDGSQHHDDVKRADAIICAAIDRLRVGP